MKVCVSVYSRFHAFDLARELHRRGHLGRLITSYPTFKAVEFGVPGEKVSSLLPLELVKRAWWKAPRSLRRRLDPLPMFADWFDRAACTRIPRDTDLYVGWSGLSERGLAEAKRLGAVTVLDRGAAHIEVQRDLLAQEYEGRRDGHAISPRVIEKEKREYEMADYISVASNFVKRSFLEKGVPEGKLIVTPYGVDLGHFRQLPRRDEVFRVVFAGAMTLQKGVHYLLQAFAELRLPDAELWLLGLKGAEIEPYFKKYEGTFRYFGPIPQARLHEYYSQCSVFAICSIQDGFGMVISQAMACGLPVICTTNTGGGDLISEGRDGFIVPIRDPEAIKARLLELYRDREACAAMGQAAKQKVSRGHTWDDYGAEITRSFEAILARARSGTLSPVG